jgi:Short C-terminal domain
MPFGRRRPLMRAAAVGGVAYMGSKAGASRANQQAQQQAYNDQNAADAEAYRQQQAQVAPPPAPTAPEPVAQGASDRITQLKELAELHDSGALTDEEFAAEKAKVLA